MNLTDPILLPRRLCRGGTIGIIAPSSPVTVKAKLESGIGRLEALGFAVRRGKSLHGPSKGYLAASDETRAEDVNSMFADPGVHAVFCARGGYGSGRILRLLDYRTIRDNPKILVGYSDVTSLMLAIWTKTRLLSFSGPMVAPDLWNSGDSTSWNSLWRNIHLRRSGRDLFANAGSGCAVIAPGIAEGRLLGGNLTVLTTLLGTRYEPDWRGCILALEDTGENVYRIDRMLNHLRSARVLGAVSGVLLGAFTAAPADEPDRDVDEVFAEYLLPLNVPVLSGMQFGHISPKMTYPIGARVRVDAFRRSVKTTHGLLL